MEDWWDDTDKETTEVFGVWGVGVNFVHHKCSRRLKQNRMFIYVVLVVPPYRKKGGLSMMVRIFYFILFYNGMYFMYFRHLILRNYLALLSPLHT